VMAACRTLFMCRVNASITSPAFFVADSIAVMRARVFGLRKTRASRGEIMRFKCSAAATCRERLLYYGLFVDVVDLRIRSFRQADSSSSMNGYPLGSSLVVTRFGVIQPS